MKIGKFALVALISILFIGLIGSVLLYTNITAFDKLKNQYSNASNLVLNADRDLYQALQAQYIIIESLPESEQFQNGVDGFNENLVQVKERIGEAFALISSKSIDSVKANYNEKIELFTKQSENLISLSSDTLTKTDAKLFFEETALKTFKELRGDIDSFNGNIDLETEKYVEDTSNISRIGIGSLIFVILINIVWLNYLASKIKKPINELVQTANAMAEGDFSRAISTNHKGEVGQLDEAFSILKKTIESLNEELMKLNQATELGNLDVRSNSVAFNGVFKDLINGMNSTLDAVIKPLNMTAEYVDRISKGDIPPKIQDDYQGDFNEIKNNLNSCIDSINLLVVDTKDLVHSTTLGRLNDRADADKHFGEFKTIIQGVNSSLDRLVGMIDNMPVAVQIVDRDYNILYANKQTREIK